MESQAKPGKNQKKNRARRDKKNARTKEYLKAKSNVATVEALRAAQEELFVSRAECDTLRGAKEFANEMARQCDELRTENQALQAENERLKKDHSTLFENHMRITCRYLAPSLENQ
ncbi:hypothetical protein QAD02_014009 [Eretmocerus hayati]|uniref:Uncharacterized protein n=1 Tax=Eretmocerus hayati TaxID=131215 RepID=A0ACC2P6Z0_9HYME|nr:hypothetical protein QAD02_014009 [Eretmocerus hayati]